MTKENPDASPLDRITEDGILSLIISSLPPKEAVRTCVLSRRWRTIWTHLSNFNFTATNILGVDAGHLCRTLEFKGQVAAIMTDKFITSVDSVLMRQQGARVDEFMIEFFLHKSQSHYLDAWLGYVLGSGTKTLVLDLRPSCLIYLLRKPGPELYDFPCQLLQSSIENLAFMSCSLNTPHGFDGLYYLKSLKLELVDITDEDVRSLLSNCFTLEYLEVCRSGQMITLSTSHPLSRLKYLTVFYCDQLKKIEIDAVNLTSLRYLGNPVDFLFRTSAQLTEASVNFKTDNANSLLNELLNKSPHLEKLNFGTEGASQVTTMINSNRFNHMRKLEWTVPHLLQNKKGGLYLASILTVAPFLEKLSLLYTVWFEGFLRELKQIKLMGSTPHTHLKTVEFIGFTGDKWQIRFALYILDCGIELESMTLMKAGGKWDQECYKNSYETNMKYLGREVPINAKLVIV